MYIPRLTVQALATFNAIKQITTIEGHRKPLVFWHGMGDSYNSDAMKRVFDVVHDYDPEIQTFSVYVDTDDSKDQRKSLFGDVNQQLDYVCEQLQNVTVLDKGFDFVGFSQGGLFARAAIERCGLNVSNLITFGSPHVGISDLPRCSENDWLCQKKNAILKSQVWKPSIQHSVVAAQYFREPLHYETYLENSAFLADINNENNVNQTYIDNLSTLDRFVLISFNQDETLVPLDSAWFSDHDKVTGEEIPFNETIFYHQDLIGLKKLYDAEKIDFLSTNGGHMEITDEFLLDVLERYLPKDQRI